MNDITVTLNFGLDTRSIRHIQLVEALVDQALLSAGYSRTESSKGGDKITFDYRQIAIIS